MRKTLPAALIILLAASAAFAEGRPHRKRRVPRRPRVTQTRRVVVHEDNGCMPSGLRIVTVPLKKYVPE